MAGLNLVDMLTGEAGQGALAQIGQQFGLQPDQARQAVNALLPAISGGLKRNVQQPGGLEALLGALQSGNHHEYLDQPERLTSPNAVADGNAILGHLLGSRDTSREVAALAAEKTGLPPDMMKQLLPAVAAMAMGSLSKQTRQQATGGENPLGDLLGGLMGQAGSSGGLGGMLGGLLGGKAQGQSAQAGGGAMDMLNKMLDANHDGNAMDDIFRMVMNRK